MRPQYFFYIFLAFCLGSFLSFIFLKEFNQSATPSQSQQEQCAYLVSRQPGAVLTNPLLFAEPVCETDTYSQMKQDLLILLAQEQKSQKIKVASVYFRDFLRGNWLEIGPDEHFHPGSLLKVPILMAFLKMEEQQPGLLQQEIVCPSDLKQKVPIQYYESKSIVAGKTYTIQELLEYMIIHSDNQATALLNSKIDIGIIKKTFTDLSLPLPESAALEYPLTAGAYSVFFKTLVNATYLNRDHSEFALNLLLQSTFNHGFLRGFPSATKTAHKFGEYIDKANDIAELHESGIVYIHKRPYLVTIMTRGKNLDELSVVLGKVSKLIYDEAAQDIPSL